MMRTRSRIRRCVATSLAILLSAIILSSCDPEVPPAKKETTRDKLESTDPAKRSEGLKEAEQKYGK